MVVRFDGDAHQPQNEETTMLNTTDKIIKLSVVRVFGTNGYVN
ncbi:hypothetical protein SAMN05444000_10172 [Shimia gijangensis]|uniref:Uncharacterized protein n=1 Tax=Shimia gijangensis TaxID=1470563 RepID=A0A1M6AXD0_9RHOB|nr:hypothetical protein SAMN05444000_10172 [Shimia gijangensis]